MCIEAAGTTNWKYSIGRFYDASGTLRDNSYMSVNLAQQNLYIGGILSVDANGKQFMTPMEYSMSLRNTDYVYKMVGGTTAGTASASPYYNHSIFSQPVFRYVDGAWIQGDGISTATPADLAKIANLPADTISDLSGKVSKTGNEQIAGIKTFVDYMVIPMRVNPQPSDAVNKGHVDGLLTSKQDKLTFDNTPVSGSSNPVKSGGSTVRWLVSRTT